MLLPDQIDGLLDLFRGFDRQFFWFLDIDLSVARLKIFLGEKFAAVRTVSSFSMISDRARL